MTGTAPVRNPWSLYDELIDGVPDGIAVRDFCLGAHWVYVEAACGTGIAKAVTGGARATFKDTPSDLNLKSVACLAKSWNFLEASLGLAALNAWYTTPDSIAALGGIVDGEKGPGMGRAENPFDSLADRYAGKNVAVVGHFPNVEAMFRTANVTVLERSCTSELDTPDPACEYVLPQQDFAFITGTTLTNKTAPRLLELAKDAFTVLVGPTSIPAQALFDAGADMIAGSVVVDAEPAKLSIRGGSKQLWRAGVKKFCVAAS